MEFLTDGSLTVVPSNKECYELDPKNDNDDKVKFYKKVRSCMISKTIKGYFRTTTIIKLKNKSDKYYWKELNDQYFNEGLMILYLLMKDCNPSIHIDVESLSKTLDCQLFSITYLNAKNSSRPNTS